MNSSTRNKSFWECQNMKREKKHIISQTERTQRCSEVETYPFSLWSHRARWIGLASFCDSLGHASCKRKTGIRGNVQQGLQWIVFHLKSMTSTTWQAQVLYVLQCIWNIKKEALNRKTVGSFKNYFKKRIKTPCTWRSLMHQTQLARWFFCKWDG